MLCGWEPPCAEGDAHSTAGLSITTGIDKIDFWWFESSRTDFISGGSPDTLIHGGAIPEESEILQGYFQAGRRDV